MEVDEMVRPKGIKRGFSKLAVFMLRSDPSITWTADELASEALQHDPTLSVAQNPRVSLAHTFEKQVRENNLPEIEVVGNYPKRYRWRTDSEDGGGSSEPPSHLSTQPSGPREYITVTVGDAQFRGPVTVENLNTGIGILQRFKEKLTT